MLWYWTSNMTLMVLFILLFTFIEIYFGLSLRKWVWLLPPIVYLCAASRTIYSLFHLPEPFPFDRYSFIVEIFPVFWLITVYLCAYFKKKGDLPHEHNL